MKKISKRFCSMLLAVMAVCSMCPGGAALEAYGEGGGTFTGVSQIAVGGYVQRTVSDADGEETVIRLNPLGKSGAVWTGRRGNLAGPVQKAGRNRAVLHDGVQQ